MSGEDVVIETVQVESVQLETVVVEPGGFVVAALDPALNGYVKGNGAGVFTAATTVPQSDIVLANDLAAVEGLGTTGIAVRTAANTWATRSIVGTSSRVSVTAGDGVAGNPTIDIDAAYAGQGSITTVGTIGSGTWSSAITASTINNSSIGATTRSTGAFTTLAANGATTLTSTLSVTGNVGINQSPNTEFSLYVGKPTGTGFSQRFIQLEGSLPSTTTNQAQGIISLITTAAGAFTLPFLIHFYAFGAAKGAGSTITSAYGFYAQNGVAVGTTNYGFYSDISAATTTYQSYMGGTAQSYFGGPVGIGDTDPLGSAIFVRIGGIVPGTLAQPTAIQVTAVASTNGTTAMRAFQSLAGTTAAAFTCTAVEHFNAFSTSKGAGSTITNVYGFRANNAIVQGTNNYGFHSDINTATTTWQAYMSGTAPSFFGGALGLGINDPVGGAGSTPAMLMLMMTHQSAATTVVGVNSNLTYPATATGICAAYRAQMTTVSAAFTMSDAALFFAHSLAKGAGSAITNAYGFFASLGMAGVANSLYGFFSNIAAAANTFAFYGAGTAASKFGGPVYHAQDNSTIQSASALFQGTGVPNNANGSNGDFYMRGDGTKAGATCLYHKEAGAWVAVI